MTINRKQHQFFIDYVYDSFRAHGIQTAPSLTDLDECCRYMFGIPLMQLRVKR